MKNTTQIFLNGIVNLVQIVRYKNKEATARVLNAKSGLPDKILFGSKTHPDVFMDEETDKLYKLTKYGLISY